MRVLVYYTRATEPPEAIRTCELNYSYRLTHWIAYPMNFNGAIFINKVVCSDADTFFEVSYDPYPMRVPAENMEVRVNPKTHRILLALENGEAVRPTEGAYVEFLKML